MASILGLPGSSPASVFLLKYSPEAALKDSVARVKLAVKEGIMDMRINHLRKFHCPITGDVPENPVLTNCGHIFDRAVIERWRDLQRHGNNPVPCPSCRNPLTQFTTIHGFQDFADQRVPKELVLTCDHFKKENPSRADGFLKLALDAALEKDYEEALVSLTQAFRHIKSSTKYAAVPWYYEESGESEKASVSRLYLSLLLLEEGKIEEALKTLVDSKIETLAVRAVIVGLRLRLDPSNKKNKKEFEEVCAIISAQEDLEAMVFMHSQMLAYVYAAPSAEEIAEALSFSSECKSEVSILFCKIIIANTPDCIEAYEKLIPLIEAPEEKREFLLKAADVAQSLGKVDLEAIFRSQLDAPLASIAISKEDWSNPAELLAKLPSKPRKLLDFLKAPCPIWGHEGKTAEETHIVVPLFSEVMIGGVSVPLTLGTLDELDKSAQRGLGYRYIWNKIPNNKPAEKEFRWAVLTKDVLPGSRRKFYGDQVTLLPPGYEVPGVLDAARAILWEKRCSGNRCFNNDKLWTFTCCKEEVETYHLVVGGFSLKGLSVNSRDCYSQGDVGLAGFRKF